MLSTSVNPPARPGSLEQIDWEAFRLAASEAGQTLPIEQTEVWDRFDLAQDGRQPWGRLIYRDVDGRDRALISLTRMQVRGFPYLWARHAPVWLGPAPTAAEEADLRGRLVRHVRHADPSTVFVRMHASFVGEDCHELLQTMTYDRTVILDLDRPTDEDLLASFKARGRRDVRKALRNEAMRFADETGRAQEAFTELYEVLLETGERDGFRPAPEQTYRTMLAALGPEHARLYVGRDGEGRVLAWSIVTVYGDGAMRYYAASSSQGRRLRAADALLYHEACWLRAEGVTRYDLMGVDSERVPELAGVREFKSKFTQSGPVDVPGAWDIPVKPSVYKTLAMALGAKRAVRSAMSPVRRRISTTSMRGLRAPSPRPGQCPARSSLSGGRPAQALTRTRG